MPSNEFGDRVHNFFAQDNSLQGNHHSQVVEGNWPVLNSNFWVGNQRQVDLLSSTNKNYTPQTSDVDRGEGSYPLHEAHDLNFTQPNLRPDFAKSQSLNEQPNLNGFMYGNEFHQTRQNEANFLAVDTDSDQRLSITSRGLSVRELQQASGPDHHTKASIRSGTSLSPVTFDLFGGHQQMSHQQSTVPQSLQRQQSGINDMQQFQHQLMIRKMQELQRQQQLQQLGLRQQDLINQVPPFAKQASGTQTTLVNGTPNSDCLQYPWSAELGTNWLNRGSPTMQVSANGLGFPPNLGQTQCSVDLVAQQVDQSLYGVPISSSRGLPGNQYSQMVTDKSSMPQMSNNSNFLQDNQHNLLPDQVGVQNESSISRHKFQTENMFGLASRQSPNTVMRNIGGLQQVNSLSRNAPQQDFLGRQDLAVRPDTSCEKPTRQVASPQNEVALDPTEEKILFGSDDNIWSAFGKPTHNTGEAGILFDNGGLSNGLPSIQSGSWSALMQSAVGETSSSDMPPQEGWSGLNFHNNDGPSGSQPLSLNNESCKQVSSLADDSLQMPSAQSSGSFAPDDINTNNVMGLNQLSQKFQNEPGQRLQTEMSQRFYQSLEEAGKWSNSGPLQSSVAEDTDASHSLQAERNAKTNSPTWVSGHTGTRLQSNGWNSLEAIPPGGERVMNNHKAEKLHQNSQNSQVRVVHGEVVHGTSLWKLNTVHSSPSELGHVKSRVASSPANQETLSSKNDASVANSCNARISEETSPFVQHNYLLNQWKNAHPSTRSQGAESLVRSLDQANDLNQVLDPMNSREKDEVARHARHEIDNCDGKENSNDSHRSNLSQHTSGSFREGDSRSLPIGKQTSTNQLPRKVSAHRKFQYHPMGNVDEDVGTYAHKQTTRTQAMYQQNPHFGQSKIFGQGPTNSTVKEKSSELQRDIEAPDEVPSRGNLSGHAPKVSVLFSRPVDAYTSSNASSSSQNMLELLHKVDQSTSHGAMVLFSSSEGNASPQLPQAEKLDAVGSLQHNQASVSQGFGLQLGPPSQRLQIPERQLSSQNGHDAFNSLYSSNAAAEMGGKDQQMVATHTGPSLPSFEETQVEFKINRSAIPDHGGNENSLYKMPGNVNLASSSAIPNSRSNVQNEHITSSTGKMLVNQRIDSNGYSSYSAQRRLAETLLPDASGCFKQDNLASSGGTSRQTGPSDVTKRVPTTTIPTRDGKTTSQHFGMSGIPRQGYSKQMLHNMWTNVPTHQNNMSIQFQQASSHTQESPQPNILESSSPLTQGQVNPQGIFDGEEQRLKESSGQPVVFANTDPVPEMEKSLGKASSMKNCLEDSPANSASTQKDIEAFGRSLRPNSFSHQNYSLLSQMQGLKDAEADSSDRVSKRMKGPESVSDVHIATVKAQQQNEHNAVGDSLGSSTGAPSEDSGMLHFSSPAEIFHKNTSQQGNVASQDMLGLSRDISESKSCGGYSTSARADHHQVSPQMAPSWFNQYGTFKNGQMLQIYDARKVTSLRPGEHVGKSSTGLDTLNAEEKGTVAPIDACQLGNSHQSSIPSLLANGHFSSQSSQLNVTGQHLEILRPKKRKSATSELHPWHRIISEGSQDLWTLSKPEADWNKATNRLAEKVEDDAELIEDGPPMLRSKRRLTLTTHLMQQLLPPSPAAILPVDATMSYEIVAYAVSRIALGDACSTVSRSSNLDQPGDSMDRLRAKSKLSERNGCRCYAKASEELMRRARKLENDFFRLDKSVSMLDLRLECQDLEKFSVINRFARFHGRGQSDNTEASTDTTPSAQKPIPQRYVTALPMPRSLPDRVQCLSL
ncbi:uncharacterized protein LOC105157976 isoform X2 [Sesamum indicum]|uniref:Uncharacterized protein LOC105157976 isoform X2 n=1 Tax=Sesamum indicum TaxID=4182 RepID=A0A8M8UXT8_SESIN|nr:uncharacterized protein LOC105157976 isoform X2 [Sesamum indicum]